MIIMVTLKQAKSQFLKYIHKQLSRKTYFIRLSKQQTQILYTYKWRRGRRQEQQWSLHTAFLICTMNWDRFILCGIASIHGSKAGSCTW